MLHSVTSYDVTHVRSHTQCQGLAHKRVERRSSPLGGRLWKLLVLPTTLSPVDKQPKSEGKIVRTRHLNSKCISYSEDDVHTMLAPLRVHVILRFLAGAYKIVARQHIVINYRECITWT
jgi:hypothetical protein